MTSYAQPHRSPAVVDRDLRETRAQLAIAPKHNLQALRDQVTQLTSRAILDPQNWRADLLFAQNALDQAQDEVTAKHGLTQRLAELEQEYGEAVRLDGVQQREDAAKRMNAAMNNFNVHVTQAGIAYRQLVITARQAGYTNPLPRFHSSTLVPMSWTGSVSEILAQDVNGLPSLNDHLKAAA